MGRDYDPMVFKEFIMIEDGAYFSWRRLRKLKAPWVASYYDRTIGTSWTKRGALRLVDQAEGRR
jgi:hypothetical protein